MSTNTSGGTTTSFSNTPQAQDDVFRYSATEDGILYLNVLANDLGGKAKVLWSIDDGESASTLTKKYAPVDLLTKDGLNVWETTDNGALIAMRSDGSIAFDTSTEAFQAYLAAAAEGQEVSESFTYAIRMANGTLSWATVTVIFTGVNDGPVANADVNGADVVVESGVNPGNTPFTGDPDASGDVLANDTDVDAGAVLTVAEVNGDSGNVGNSVDGTYGSLKLNSDGSWTYTLNNSDTDTNAIAQGDTVTDVFTYTVTDEHGATATTNLTINITGTNDGPTATADDNTGDAVSESGVNPGNTPFAGDASASGNVLTNDTDPDTGETATLVVSAVNGVGGNVGNAVTGTYGSLTLDGDGTWSYALENTDTDTNSLTQGQSVSDVFSYTIVDAFGATSTANLTINITGTNDAPTDLTFDGGTVAENSANGTVVASVDTVVDPDHVTGFTFDLTDNAGGRFTIDATGIITVANESLLDYETNTSHNITVRVTDALGATYSEVLTINVTDVPENQAPTDIILSSTSVQENSLNVLLGTLSTVDLDDVSGFTYTLVNSADGRFALLNGNEIHIARGDLLDFEVATSHQIEVKVEDSSGGIYTEIININLTDMASVTSFGGTNGADIVDGTSGNNSLSGSGGDDRLYGGEGNDTLSGGTGLDALYGQGGNDTLSGDSQNDFVLDGGAGNDILTGGGGNDVLIGGIGADTMDGGGNNDLFIWRAEDLGTGVDVINNFGPGTGPNGDDTLQIGDLLVGYVEGVSTKTDFVQVTAVGSNVMVSVDTDGAVGGPNFVNLVQVNSTTVTAVTNALDFSTYTRTDHIG